MRLYSNNYPVRPASVTGGQYRVEVFDGADAIEWFYVKTFSELLTKLAASVRAWDRVRECRYEHLVGYWLDGERGLRPAEREAIERVGATQIPVPDGYVLP